MATSCEISPECTSPSRLPTPDSRLPTPLSQTNDYSGSHSNDVNRIFSLFPVPCSLFPVPCSLYLIPKTHMDAGMQFCAY
ncbi:hypothetical protein [Moorena sp. SIO4G3]|uniref:hypothetical protein n=1 Tax=Moorena sp. SIO4G3 TaxID=2607821 RepID=UPI00142A90CC|nr:hypothetical protein [Moorena sp. SIO4G3]NEO82053.1 hypothetical protein [Moorena sp. SIO4G3]